MLLVDDILFSPMQGILWIFREIHKAAEAELEGEGDAITERLRQLYMQLETGQITEAQFDQQETVLLDRLEAISGDEDDEEENGDEDEEDDETPGFPGS